MICEPVKNRWSENMLLRNFNTNIENRDRFPYEMSVMSTLHGAATFTPHSTEDNWLIMSYRSILIHDAWRIHLDPPDLEPLFCVLLPWERECPPCYEPIYYRKKPSLRLIKEVLQRQHGEEWRDRRRNETYPSKIFPLAKSTMVHHSRTILMAFEERTEDCRLSVNHRIETCGRKFWSPRHEAQKKRIINAS